MWNEVQEVSTLIPIFDVFYTEIMWAQLSTLKLIKQGELSGDKGWPGMASEAVKASKEAL